MPLVYSEGGRQHPEIITLGGHQLGIMWVNQIHVGVSPGVLGRLAVQQVFAIGVEPDHIHLGPVTIFEHSGVYPEAMTEGEQSWHGRPGPEPPQLGRSRWSHLRRSASRRRLLKRRRRNR